MGSKVRAIAIFIAAVLFISAPGAVDARQKRSKNVYRVKYTYSSSLGYKWAQDRINQGYTTRLDGKATTPNSYGSGIDVYIVDSGVGAEDCANHGSMVASVVSNLSIGIATGVNIISIKVLDCKGETTEEKLVNAINSIKETAVPSRSVVNISIGGAKSAAVDAAASSLGLMMPVVVAAGNEFTDACKTSPAGASNVITVGGVDKYQYMAWFSNHGQCVDIWAPGKSVDAIDKNGASRKVSGTSISAPLVTAAIAWVADRDNSTTMEAALTVFRESSDAPVMTPYHSGGEKPFSLWIRDVPVNWIRTDYPTSLP
jgi:hypothetical protein